MKRTTILLMIAWLAGVSDSRELRAAPFDQTDDFEDGTTMNWAGGQTAPPVNVPSGGPDGADDNYLRIVTTNFHLGTRNTNQWTGDFASAGMLAIEMDMQHIDPGPDRVRMRLMVQGAGATFASRDRTPEISTNTWSHYRFGLSTGDLVHVTGGAGVLSDALQAVTKLWVRHDSAVPTLPGAHPPHITATLGIDNIRAVRESDLNWPQVSVVDALAVAGRPVYATHAGDGSGRLFVVNQPGLIEIIKNGVVLAPPFLDISSSVTGGTSGGSEQGLLGLAFPPGPGGKQHFYVYYYAAAPNRTVLSRFRVDTNNADVADDASEEILIEIAQPQGNHNGGQICFGGDGYLYLGSGDGGGANDDDAGHASVGNGQSTETLLGKLLRLDVETTPLTNGYAVPGSNPFVGDTNALDEIWAYGLRNPYRFSFDRATHDLYVGDVGQSALEEVDFQPAASAGGENYGWRRYEGSQCTGIQGDPCGTNGLTFPVHEYAQTAERDAVVGGYVHRGVPAWSFLYGTYLYADYSSGEIWGLKRNGTNWHNLRLRSAGFSISGFGEDEHGDVYVCAIFNDAIHRIEETLADSDGDGMPDAYEIFYGFFVNNVADADADPDMDGMTNLGEFFAGTNPTNAASNLRILSVEALSSNQTVLTWSSVSQRWYGVEETTNLLGPFAPVASNLPATPPSNTFTGSIETPPAVFYRVNVRQ